MGAADPGQRQERQRDELSELGLGDLIGRRDADLGNLAGSARDGRAAELQRREVGDGKERRRAATYLG